MGYNIKRTADDIQTDLDTVDTAEIAASAVTAAKLATSAVTTAKINASAVTSAKMGLDDYVMEGLFVKPSGAGLDILVSQGLIKQSGTVYAAGNAADDKTAGDFPLTATVSTTGCEKVGIVQVSGETVSVKYGTEVTADAGTAGYPSADAGNLVLARLFTAGAPIHEDTSVVSGSMINNTVSERY